MQKNNHAKNPLLALITLPGQLLIAIGTPVLLLLKLLIFFSVLLGEKALSLGEKAVPFGIKTLSSGKKSLSLAKTSLPKTVFTRFPAPKLPSFPKFRLPNLSLQGQITTLKSVLFLHLPKLPTTKPSKRIKLSKQKNVPKPTPIFIFPKLALPTLTFPHVTLPKPSLRLPKLPRLVGAGIASISAAIIIFLVFYFSFFVLTDLPHPKLLAAKPVPLTTKIYDRNGVLLYQFHGDENRTLAKLSDLPAYVPEAVIAAEDKNFYHHIGFDPAGITRAAIANYSGESSQGGSTITQQLIKFSLLNPERTITRKIRELILSLWAERLYTKDEILTMYLNYIGFGGPAYGIEAASEIYFGKSAKQLTLAEASLLAALPSAPTTYSPFGDHPEIAKFRQMQVLDKMHEQGYITKIQAENAKKEQLTFVPNETEIKAPHFVMYVKDHLVERFGEKTVSEGGLQVTTSLDYDLYKKITDQVKTGVKNQSYLNVQNGAALVTNPRTGEILAMAGSTDFFDLAKDGNVNVTTAERSPGSSIKPLTYALGFENNLLTPNTIIDDSPTAFRQIGGPVYRPVNYDNRFHGRMTARTALASSFNIPAVKVLERVGLVNFLQFAVNAGLTTLNDPNRYGLAITLGGGEVKMTDMATAYSIFPNEGVKVPLKSILSIKTSSGTNLPDWNPEKTTTLISPKTAYFINSILSDDGARAPTFGRGSYLNIPGHTVAVKTGTTETKRDNWTIGYSFGADPRLVAVWVGNNDNSPMSPALESGNTGAAAIWNPIMQEVLKTKPNAAIPKPEDLIPVQVCGSSGLITEYLPRGTEASRNCPTPTPTPKP